MGNSEKVAKIEVKRLRECHELRISSKGKLFTRHFTNLYLTLPYDELVFINFIVFMSDHINVFKYDTKLLKKFSEAAKRANEIYPSENKVKFNTSIPSLRKSFISMVENGLIIPLVTKYEYMICPSLVYNQDCKSINGVNILDHYIKIYNGAEPVSKLKLFCEQIKESAQLKKYKGR